MDGFNKWWSVLPGRGETPAASVVWVLRPPSRDAAGFADGLQLDVGGACETVYRGSVGAVTNNRCPVYADLLQHADADMNMEGVSLQTLAFS